MRTEFAQAMLALFEKRQDLVFITGDLGYMALEGVAKAYGERFVNAGVAEQNAVSLAAGLAHEGHARIDVRMDRDRANAHAARGSDDAPSNLAAIGD